MENEKVSVIDLARSASLAPGPLPGDQNPSPPLINLAESTSSGQEASSSIICIHSLNYRGVNTDSERNLEESDGFTSENSKYFVFSAWFLEFLPVN